MKDQRADKSQERLAQAQRLESLGQLAGGVAHDFNSPPRPVADPGRLEQVLVNLAVNARDAMPGGGAPGRPTGLR